MQKSMTPEQFWEKVKKSEGCWLWTAGKNNRGYGQFRRMRKNTLAHRYSYLISVGEIPVGVFVLHKCDTPLCVRPSHLWLGSQKDNMTDCAQKGRLLALDKHARGTRIQRAVLNENMVKTIRWLHERGWGTTPIARVLGIDRPSTIDHVVNERSWSHVL